MKAVEVEMHQQPQEQRLQAERDDMGEQRGVEKLNVILEVPEQ